jgi:ADP-ribose pyrophosphatase YjhB (NUDIX family)
MTTEIAAGGIVIKKGDPQTFLICTHSQSGDIGFPKGLVGDEDINETKEVAALREVRQEGGVEAKIIFALPDVVRYTRPARDGSGESISKEVYYYGMEYILGDPKDHDYEMSDAGFYPAEEVLSLLTHQRDKEIFKKALSFFESNKE